MNSTRFPAGLIAVLLVAALAPSFARGDTSQSTTVIVVRHAEKQSDGDDPELTLAGEERSHRLRDMTLKAEVTAVFASQFQRTQATVRPLAEALELEVTTVDAGDTPALVAKILSDHRGGVVVVAGHSNTVPGIVAALGAPEPDLIDESDYGNLFIVAVPESGEAVAVRLRF